jgi:phage terminase small subunit
MPRRSPEDRAAGYYRAAGKPPAPPAILSAKAAALWRKIAKSRPYDYFDEASQVLLAQFCELSITQRVNIEMMRRDPGDEKWQRMVTRMQSTLNSLSVKLRLSPSTVLSKKHTILTEKAVDAGDNVLLFGGPKLKW